MRRKLGLLVLAAALCSSGSARAWITTFEGSGDDTSEAFALAVDADGDVVAAGLRPTAAKLDGATGGKIWQTSAFDGTTYGFGVALASDGSPIVAGGWEGDQAGFKHFFAILDADSGDALVAEQSIGQQNYRLLGVVASPPANPVVFGDAGRAYVAMRGSWETTLAPHELQGFASGRIWDAAVDAAGDVVVVGQSDSLAVDQYGRLHYDGRHLLAAKLSGVDGSTIWQYVIDDASVGWELVLDGNGDALLAGTVAATAGTGWDMDDMLVVKLANADGAELWRRQIDGGVDSPNDVALDVAADANGDAIVAGRLTLSQSDPLWRGGLAEFAVLKLAGSDGSELWRYTAPNTTLAPDPLPGLSGTKGEARAIAFDSGGDPVVTGVTNASWFESGTTGHVADFTVAKVANADGSQQWLYVPGAGQPRAIAAAADGIVVAGHLNRETPDDVIYDMAVIKLSEGVLGSSVHLLDSPDPTRRRLKLVSKSKLTSPYSGRYGDPTYDGARLVLSDPESGTEQVIDLPASQWHARGKGFEFVSYDGPCRLVRIDGRRGVSAKCQGAAVYLPTGRATRGALGVRLELGPPRAVRYCMAFGGDVVRDDGIRFKAKKAPAPARCPD